MGKTRIIQTISGKPRCCGTPLGRSKNWIGVPETNRTTRSPSLGFCLWLAHKSGEVESTVTASPATMQEVGYYLGDSIRDSVALLLSTFVEPVVTDAHTLLSKPFLVAPYDRVYNLISVFPVRTRGIYLIFFILWYIQLCVKLYYTFYLIFISKGCCFVVIFEINCLSIV